jgi:hypothetical protein
VAYVRSLDLKPLQTLITLLAEFVFANYTLTESSPPVTSSDETNTKRKKAKRPVHPESLCPTSDFRITLKSDLSD